MRRRRFSSLAPAIVQGAGRGLYKGANAIINESLPLVPVETGTLKASARVNEPEVIDGRLEVRAGYGYGDAYRERVAEIEAESGDRLPAAGYSVYVHEITTNRHEPPTQAKFLEQPALEHKPLLPAEVAVEIRKALRKAASA